MARPTIVPVVPRVLNTATLCAYLGRSESWLAEHRVELETQGFPQPVALIGGYDRIAVDRWLDQRSGLIRADEGPVLGASWDKPTTNGRR